MQNKIKIYRIALLCLLFLAIGCSKDDYNLQNPSGSVTTARSITLNEFEQQTLPFQKYKETQNNIARAKTSRLLYNTRYGFTIDTDEIVSMEKDGKHSYTFPIHRDIDNGKVENYVLNEDASGEFQEFIAKYTLTELEKQKIENHEPVDLNDKTEIARLSFLGPVNPCESAVINIERTYDANGHENGCIITYLIPKGCEGAGATYQVYETMDSGGESGGTSGGGDWSWTGGLPGDNSGPSTPTSPTTPGGDNGTGGIPTQTTPGGSTGDQTITSSSGHHEYHDTTLLTQVIVPKSIAIVKLEEITNDNSKPYKAKVAILQQSLNEPLEKGFEFRTNDDGSLQPAIFVQGSVDSTPFGVPVANALVRMHDHPNHLDPVFSAQDIAGMAEFFVVKNDFEANDDEDITSLMITRTGAFALKVDDINKVWNFNQLMKFGKITINNKDVAGSKVLELSYKDDVINKARDLCNNTCTDAQYISYLEANLLTWFNSWNTGLGLYKGTLKPDGTYNWTKIN